MPTSGGSSSSSNVPDDGEAAVLWQARVSRDWRFFFLIQDETYIIVTIVPHPK